MGWAEVTMASIHVDESEVPLLVAGLFIMNSPAKTWWVYKMGMRSQLIVWQGNDGILYFPLLSLS